MAGLFGFFSDDDNERRNDNDKTSYEGRLHLREEKLDVTKSKVQKGEVELSKDIIEERKAVDVPVTHEEVVIERRAIDDDHSDVPITSEETIRIPVSEEKVNIDKHTVVKGEISAYKREIEDTRHVEETLKREEAHINTKGDPDIIDKDRID